MSAWGAPPERWSLDQRDCPLQVLRSERVVNAIPMRTPSRHSEADHFHVRTGLGTRLDVVAPLPLTPVIDELTIDVCMRCDLPGALIALRVVLPRSPDPASGRLTTVLLPGPRYGAPGTWQTLRMEKLTAPLADQVRILRSQLPYPIDSREAYVDAVVVNGYCGVGETDLWLGDPRIDELLPVQQTSLVQPLPPFVSEQPPPAATVQTRGGLLEVDGVPYFARVIDAQGEDWSYLQELGFNCVRLNRPVTAHDLAAAERHGLWIIARPPNEQEWLLIEEHCGRVLLWDLSTDPLAMDPDYLRQLSATLQVATKRHVRPFASIASSDDPLPTRIEVAIRPSIHESVTGPIPARSMNFRDNRPWWGIVPTNISEAVADQLPWFGVDPSAMVLEEEQIQLQALAAVRAGARGLLFQSNQRLDAPTPNARQRSLALRQLNAALDTIAPWLSGGVLEQIGDDAVTWQSKLAGRHRSLDGIVLFKPIGSLAVLSHGNYLQPFVPSPRVDVGYSVTVKDRSADVFQLASDTVRRVPSRSIPGGVAVTLEQPQSVDYLVFANDSGSVEELARRWTRGHAQRLDRALALASMNIDDTANVLAEVDRQVPQRLESLQLIERARAETTRASYARVQQEWNQAWVHLWHAQANIALARRQTWDYVLNGQPPQACPLTMQFSSLGNYLRWRQSHSFAAAGWNVLPEGNCNQFDAMQLAGWQWRDPTNLPRELHFQERQCLALECATERFSKLMSPPISIDAGQFVRIQGWINIPVDSVELLVYDSYTGRELADHHRETKGWELFTIYRAASSDRPLIVTFELTGSGTIYLDELSVVVGH